VASRDRLVSCLKFLGDAYRRCARGVRAILPIWSGSRGFIAWPLAYALIFIFAVPIWQPFKNAAVFVWPTKSSFPIYSGIISICNHSIEIERRDCRGLWNSNIAKHMGGLTFPTLQRQVTKRIAVVIYGLQKRDALRRTAI